MQISQETTSYQQLHTSQVTVQTYSVVQAQNKFGEYPYFLMDITENQLQQGIRAVNAAQPVELLVTRMKNDVLITTMDNKSKPKDGLIDHSQDGGSSQEGTQV